MYDVIECVKKRRGVDSFLHKESAGFFYGIMSKATKVDMQNTSDFKMMDRKVVNSILSLPERNMFFRATSSWVGYKTTYVEFVGHEREAGESKLSTLLHLRRLRFSLLRLVEESVSGVL